MKHDLHEWLRRLFAAGREEFFEDGMESNFSRELVACIEEHNEVAIETIRDLADTVNPSVLSEALRWIGQMEHDETYQARFNLLTFCLTHAYANVRDGAGLGLASMDDPQAIPYLERAIADERVSELKRDLEMVLEQLVATGVEIRNDSKT